MPHDGSSYVTLLTACAMMTRGGLILETKFERLKSRRVRVRCTCTQFEYIYLEYRYIYNSAYYMKMYNLVIDIDDV